MPDGQDLAALVGSRICHDLISPIGAIGNGLELLMMDGSGSGPEMALISESVGHATARIRFLRVAFGLAQPLQRLGRPEVQSILSDLTRGSRLQIEWQGPDDMPRREVKLVFLLIQCLESAMAFGGKIVITVGNGRWILLAEAIRLKVDPELWAILTDPAAAMPVTPAQVQFPLAAADIARHGRRLACDIRETEIRLSF